MHNLVSRLLARLKRIRVRTWAGLAIAGTLATVVITYAVAGFFAADAFRFQPGRAGSPVAIVYLTGDMGLWAGTAPPALAALRGDDVPVLAISTPTLFRVRRDADFAAGVLTRAIAGVQARSGAARVLVIGQSYGADIAEVALPQLGDATRAHVAGALLIVPGRHVYFRADPTSLVYRFAPDADGAAAIARIRVPLVCVQGETEADGSCAFATQARAVRLTLPGGHALRGDYQRINQLIAAAIGAASKGKPA